MRFGGGGQSRGRRTTGTGKGRQLHPIGNDGRRMLCNTCVSSSHGASQRNDGEGKGRYRDYA
eukprot:7503277-Pyramimonas_sp.AAC.1